MKNFLSNHTYAIILAIVLLMLSLQSKPQDTLGFNRNFIGLTATELLFVDFRISYERKINPSTGIKLEIGYKPDLTNFTDATKIDLGHQPTAWCYRNTAHWYYIAVAYKYYFNRDKTLYLSPEFFYNDGVLTILREMYNSKFPVPQAFIVTTDAFFKDFGSVLAHIFSGVRHDSGDPIEFGYKVIEHYKKLGIDPRTKVIIFSDGLDIPEVIRIYKEFTGLIGISFGVGTNLTNDVGVEALNIVIKLLTLNDTPLVKLSDNPGKTMGDAKMVDKVRIAYGVEQ